MDRDSKGRFIKGHFKCSSYKFPKGHPQYSSYRFPKGNIPWNKGKKYKMKNPVSEETRKNISKALLGRKLSKEHIAKMSKSLRGRKPWNKGKKTSLEIRKKISASKKGQPSWNKGIKGKKSHMFGKKHTLGMRAWNKGLTKETDKRVRKYSDTQTGKPRLYTRGEKNHFWKGGITKENFKIRQSLEYKIWRRKIFKRDNYTCVICGKRGGNLHADHIKPFALFPELRFRIDNGRVLCEDCDKKTYTYLNSNMKREDFYGDKVL